MKAFLVGLALVVVAALAEKAVTDELIRKINSANANWVAGHNFFSEMELEDAKSLLGTILPVRPQSSAPLYTPKRTPRSSAPATFDAREKWPTCIHPIRDQAHCGSCWAFSASETLSDRFCIASTGSVNVVLSPQDLVSCDKGDMGCEGGYLNKAWEYLVHSGIVSDVCMPYTSGGGVVETCPSKCKDGSAMKKYHAKSYSHIGGILPFGRVEKIENELYANGPIQVGFKVYNDFLAYQSGVYKHTTGELLGGHAVKLIGWGNEGGEDYWLIANSWGTSWAGLKGFFKILKGKDECGIEAEAYAGPAAV